MDKEAAFLDAILKETASLPKSSLLPRALNEDNNNDQTTSYLVDANGDAYEPYSLAWRYLGMYIDCDIEEHNNGDKDGNDNSYSDDVFRERRQLTDTSHDNDNNNNKSSSSLRLRRNLASGDNGDSCSRKLLWAAYHDPQYKDGQIGEYQFYDWRSGEWDQSTCETKRCAKMDCHAKRTHFQLVGVFKETDGLVDWAEQLIKHEGYCVWNDAEAALEDDDNEDGQQQNSHSADGDGSGEFYEFMYNRQNYWTQGCTAMYLTDSYGNALWRDIKPLPGGNITDGMYWDEDCTQKASMTFPQYIVKFYSKYYYDSEKGEEVATQWQENVIQWNSLMQDFKVCQPCRAYSKTPSFDNDAGDDHRKQLRFLNDNAEDGEGDSEQWGYNCYDDAGYTNCNQCYKFETKTDLELASAEDLERASSQGTILAVKVDGTIYGKGGLDWYDDDPKSFVLIIVLLSMLGLILLSMTKCKCKNGKASMCKLVERVRSRRFHHNLRKAFFEEEDDHEEEEAERRLKTELEHKRELIERQQQEMENMRLEMDQESSIRAMDWQNSHGVARDQFEDEPPTDDEWIPIEDKFIDEPDDEAGNTDSSSDSEEGTVGSSTVESSSVSKD